MEYLLFLPGADRAFRICLLESLSQHSFAYLTTLIPVALEKTGKLKFSFFLFPVLRSDIISFMYMKLLLTFAYIGAFTFGGGYAMLPMFQRELVEKKDWLTKEELADLFSISQCLPGIIAANTALFVGYKHKGVIGGIVAAFGVALPSLIIISAIAAFLTNFTDIPIVQRAFTGLRVCVSVLIVNAVFKLRKNSVVDLPSAAIFAVIFILAVFMLLPVAVLVLISGVCGVAISLLRKRAVAADALSSDMRLQDQSERDLQADSASSKETNSDDNAPDDTASGGVG